MKNKIVDLFKEKFSRKNKLIFISFALSLILTSLVLIYPVGSIKFISTLVGALFLIIFLVVWFIVGFKISKVFVRVGAEISILLLVSQLYCGVNVIRTDDSTAAIKLLLGFSFLYLIYKFVDLLYLELEPFFLKKEEVKNNKGDKKVIKTYSPWLLMVITVMCSSMFLFILTTALQPIVDSLCILK